MELLRTLSNKHGFAANAPHEVFLCLDPLKMIALLSIRIMAFFINQTMIFMVSALSSYVFWSGSVDDLCNTICTMIHLLLSLTQPLQLLLVVTSKRANRRRSCAHLFSILLLLFLGFLHLLVVAILAAFTPFETHLVCLLLALPHLAHPVFL